MATHVILMVGERAPGRCAWLALIILLPSWLVVRFILPLGVSHVINTCSLIGVAASVSLLRLPWQGRAPPQRPARVRQHPVALED